MDGPNRFELLKSVFDFDPRAPIRRCVVALAFAFRPAVGAHVLIFSNFGVAIRIPDRRTTEEESLSTAPKRRVKA